MQKIIHAVWMSFVAGCCFVAVSSFAATPPTPVLTPPTPAPAVTAAPPPVVSVTSTAAPAAANDPCRTYSGVDYIACQSRLAQMRQMGAMATATVNAAVTPPGTAAPVAGQTAPTPPILNVSLVSSSGTIGVTDQMIAEALERFKIRRVYLAVLSVQAPPPAPPQAPVPTAPISAPQ